MSAQPPPGFTAAVLGSVSLGVLQSHRPVLGCGRRSRDANNPMNEIHRKLGAESGASIDWHELPAEEVMRLLEVNRHARAFRGEVRRRQEQFGPNQLTLRKGRSEWLRFLLQFHQPLIYILLAARGHRGARRMGGCRRSSSASSSSTPSSAILQEAKAEKAIDALAQMVVTEATVRRDGRKQRVPSDELVPGDVVLLQSGDKVPADLRLFHVRNLQVDESALTGESVPVEKHADAAARRDRSSPTARNLAFAGTLVTYGQAEGVVWATGDQHRDRPHRRG